MLNTNVAHTKQKTLNNTTYKLAKPIKHFCILTCAQTDQKMPVTFSGVLGALMRGSCLAEHAQHA